MKDCTKSENMAADVAALLRARNPLLWIVTREEARAEAYLFEAAASAGYRSMTWDVGQGVCDMSGKIQSRIGSPDPGETLLFIADQARSAGERTMWVMRDLAPWLAAPIGITTCRQLRNLARLLPTVGRETAQAVIVVSPSAEIPAELQGHATVIDWPLPDREEIASILDAAVNSLPDEIKASAAPNGTRDAAIDAAVGLSGEEAASCYARSLVQLRKIDPAVVSREKKRVIARERILEWVDPLPGGLDAVGGLDQLKAWLVSRRLAYTAQARAYGLPAPRGAMIVGIPGCGKSLTAKAIATAWQVPLLRVDLGALKSKFVGESESRLRRVFEVVETIGRCVVWFDEIEKALQGATSGAADGGVSSDYLGAVLLWMQERAGEAFVIATANDVSSLPPELLRKGRFDELWWVDLPTWGERVEIADAALNAHGRNTTIAMDKVANATENFTGAEIAALVPDALFRAYADGGREITTDDLLAAAATVVPLVKSMPAKIEALRDWGKQRARPATTPEATSGTQQQHTRAIDL